MSVIAGLAACITLTNCAKNERYHLVDVGDKAPEFEAFFSGGVHVSSSELLGKITVVFFFESTNSRCREEIYQVNEIYRRIGDVVNVVSFDLDGVLQDTLDYWWAYEIELPFVCCDYAAEIYSRFNGEHGHRLPMVFILDEKGYVCDLFDYDRPFYAEDFYIFLNDKLY